MRNVRWKWLLPLAQLVFAVACHVYGPHEYRANRRRDHATGDGLDYYERNYPALSERISLGINFPAMVLDYPLRNSYSPEIYSHNSAYTFISIEPKDIGFFGGIVLFWHWMGRLLDRRLGPLRETTRPRAARAAGLACGLAFGVLTAIYANTMIGFEFRPERQIGTFGIVWAAVLVAYFGWRLTRGFGAAKETQ